MRSLIMPASVRAVIFALLILLVPPFLIACDDDIDGHEPFVGEDIIDPPPPLAYAGMPFGASVLGRPIVSERFGHEGPFVYLFFTIHGNERPAEQLGQRMRTHLLLNPGLVEGLQVYYTTQTNPDGYVADTRRNANDIDLNRNFPARNFDNTNAPHFGPYGGSEPETQAIVAVVEDGAPSVIVSTHSPLNVVNYDGPALVYAQAASSASGYQVREDLGPYPGSFGSYAGVELQIPTITFELEQVIPSLSGHEPGISAITAIMDLAATHEAPTGNVMDLIPEATPAEQREWPYAAWKLGESAGLRPLVVERFGETRAPVLVVSGLDGEMMSVFLAERIRALLLGRLHPDAAQRALFLYLLANPDGVAAGRRENSHARDPDAGFPASGAAMADLAPETAALMALVDDMAKAGTPFAGALLLQGGACGVHGDGRAATPLQQPWDQICRAREDEKLAARPGSLAAWLADRDVPVITVALTDAPVNTALGRANLAAQAILQAADRF